MKTMTLPDNIKNILSAITERGFEAYVVGGAVRDFLLGRPISDYDVTTNALPEQVKEIFAKTVDTGLKHGTVTVIENGAVVEVTTYRVDGVYEDHRRPATVEFSKDLKSDLSRRDFTMNALACDQNGVITDYFGGIEDIERGVIKTVGIADERFEEDALRMLRAIRFACTTGFEIDEEILKSISRKASHILYVSGERIKQEMDKALMSDNIFMLKKSMPLLREIFPELFRCFSVEQNNVHHSYNVGDHILKSVSCTPKKLPLRWAMLMHDMGKPFTKTVDADGDHFKGHEKMSLSIAQRIFEKLHFSNSERSCIKTMIENHDLRLTGDKIEIKKLLSKIGNEYFEDLLAVQRADAMAQNEALVEAKLDKLALIQREYETIVANNEPYLVKHLAVDGNDILELGIQGSAVGKTLAFLQDAVIADSGKNNRETLLKLVEARR
ncbi:MAG: CCA tRNA nucleotidyltransferase [Ruminococcaceae bacterium]|nr:CCA tRNA nucleotidyltransferase [Oscillospiraceae bacterium]